MRFKELTPDQIEYIKKCYNEKDGLSYEKRATKLSLEFDVSERTIRYWWANLNLTEKIEVEPEQYQQARLRKFDKTKKCFIVAWAQNNTNVHKGFLENIEALASEYNADIHMILGRYRNPTSPTENGDTEEEWWDESILKYADANRHDIHKYVSIMSDVKVQPTAINPMSGMQGMSGVNSCVFGAPKVQFEMIPVLDGNKPKMMFTTGAITYRNYSDSKAGKKGEFHHTLGFCVIEIKDKETFFARQVTADDKTGNFTDLYYRVEGGKVSRIDSIEAIVFGDIHYGHHDQEVLNTTMDFLDKIKPKHVILHDVFDGNSISHHEMKNPFIQYGKEIAGTNDLKKEIDGMMSGLKEFEHFDNVVIVRSNHDDFLDRWLQNEDWKKQPTHKNSRLYMQMSDTLLGQYEKDTYNVIGVIPSLIKDRFPKYKTLSRSASYKVKGGWELGQHGDVGANGSRGSLLQFRKLNTKIIVGHYHSPGRKDGALAVGTSTKLRVGYNQGPSSWLQSHVIIHNDGRAQHLNFLKGENGKAYFTTLE
jgi:hypothetical protein